MTDRNVPLKSFQNRYSESKEQEESHLDALELSVANLHMVGNTINQEVKDHILLLDEIQERTENAHDRMNSLGGRMTHFAKHKASTCCLWVWIVLLGGLIVAEILLIS